MRKPPEHEWDPWWERRAEETAGFSPNPAPADTFPDGTPALIAETVFVEGLIRHWTLETSAAREQRLAQAMENIRGAAQPRETPQKTGSKGKGGGGEDEGEATKASAIPLRPLRQSGFWRSGLGLGLGGVATIAAAIVLTVVLGWGRQNSSGVLAAETVLNRVLDEADRLTDRHYRILIQIPTQTPGNVPRTREGDVYLRGKDRIAVRLPAPLGGDLWLGRTPDHSWFLPARGPGRIGSTEQFSALGRIIPPLGVEPGYLHLNTILHNMQRSGRYVLTLETMEPPDSRDENARPQVVLRGVLSPSRDAGAFEVAPDRITIFADRFSGIADFVRLEWSDAGPTVTFQRTNDPGNPAARPEDWYEPESHQTPGQPLLRIGEPTNPPQNSARTP